MAAFCRRSCKIIIRSHQVKVQNCVLGGGDPTDSHGKKMIAPVVITVLLLAYLIVYFVFLVHIPEIGPFSILFALPLPALGIGMVYALITRIKEIRSGEEDDLGNY